MVGGPAHGPRVYVVELAACARARTLVTLAILKQLLLAMSHRCRDGAVVPRRDEGQPSQNGGDGDNVDDGPGLALIQLLCAALARLPPPGGGVPAADQMLRFTLSLYSVCIKNKKLNFPLFSCFLTHYSAGKQARQLHPLTGATWVLQHASTVKISASQSLCSTVHS